MTGPVVIDPHQVDGAGGQMGTQGDQFGAQGAPSVSGQLPTQQAAAAAIAAEQADRQRLAAGVTQTGDQTQQAAGAYGGTEATNAGTLGGGGGKGGAEVAQGIDTGAMTTAAGTMFAGFGQAIGQVVSGLGQGLATEVGQVASGMANVTAGTVGNLTGAVAKNANIGAMTTGMDAPAAPDPNAKSDAAVPAHTGSGAPDQQRDTKTDKQR